VCERQCACMSMACISTRPCPGPRVPTSLSMSLPPSPSSVSMCSVSVCRARRGALYPGVSVRLRLTSAVSPARASPPPQRAQRLWGLLGVSTAPIMGLGAGGSGLAVCRLGRVSPARDCTYNYTHTYTSMPPLPGPSVLRTRYFILYTRAVCAVRCCCARCAAAPHPRRRIRGTFHV